VTVAMCVQNTNGVPQRSVRIRCREEGRRYIILYPFAPSWVRQGPLKETVSGDAGAVTVMFRDDRLKLEEISIDRRPLTNFMVVFHDYTGRNFTNIGWKGTSFRYGVYTKAPDPYRQKYTIIVE
jgi:hypothetical protein